MSCVCVPIWWALFTIAGTACRRSEDSVPQRVEKREDTVAALCELEPLPLRLQPTGRVIAIGDLHGDLNAARAALRLAGAIDESERWIGGNMMIVQTGDILDRGDHESQIIELFERLETESRAVGGDVVLLIGNHELMNAVADLRFVTPAGLRDFGGDRVTAWRPGGTWAKRYAAHRTAAIINTPGGATLVSHAGVTSEWIDRLDEINQNTRCWLAGQDSATRRPAIYLSNDSPVWTRAWGRDPIDCEGLEAVLSTVDAKRMVVAHTPQLEIGSACNGALWRIDAGLSSHFNGPIQVLELGEAPTVLTGTR